MLKQLLGTTALAALVLAAGCSDKTTQTASAGQEPAVGASSAPTDTQGATEAKQAVADTAAAPDLPQPAIVVPPRPKPGVPHGPGFDMPMIETGGYAPPRPMDVLKDAHVFTADHPEVASYIPCYCGCGAAGHKNNADCFVGARDKEGRVTQWVPHGAACAVCIDIAVESMRMRNSGASVSAIRSQIQSEYRPKFPSTETPTPAPPPGK